MKNLKIGMKLAIGFGLMVVVVVAIAIVGGSNVMMVDSNYSYVLDYPNAMYVELKDIEVALMNLRRTTFNIAINTGNADAINSAETAARGLMASLNSLFEALRNTNNRDPKMSNTEKSTKLGQINDIENAVQEYWNTITEQMFVVARSGNLQAAIADVYDALTTDRPYRKWHSHKEAVEIIMNGSGTHFDPELIDVFLECENEFEKVNVNRNAN